MNPTARTIGGLANTAMDGAVANREQALLLFNESPEVDSLAELVVALRHRAPTPAEIDLMIDFIRRLVISNDFEHGVHTELAGQLDELARAYRRAELADRLHETLGIKAIARKARPALATIAAGADAEPSLFLQATDALREIFEVASREQLESASLRNELGPGRHDQLLGFLPKGRT